MKSRNILLIVAGVAIYITLSLIHAINKPQPIDQYATTVQQQYEQQVLLEQKQLPVSEAEEAEEISKQQPAPQPMVYESEFQQVPLSQDIVQVGLAAGLQKKIEPQEKLTLTQDSALFKVENVDVSLQTMKQETEGIFIEKQMAEILPPDFTFLQAILSKQSDYIQEIEGQLTKQINSIQQLTGKNTTLIKENKQFSGKLQDQNEIIQQLSALIELLGDDLQAEALTMGLLVDEKNSLSKRLNQEIKKSNELIQSMGKHDAELAGAEQTINELKAALAEIQSKLALNETIEEEKRNHIAQLQDEVQTLFTENTTIMGLLSKAESATVILKEALGKAELKAEAMFHYGQEQENVALQFTEKNHDLQQQLIEKEDNLLILKDKQIATDKKLISTSESLGVVKTQLNEMSAMLTAKEEKFFSLQNERQVQRAGDGGRQVALEAYIVLMSKTIETLNHELTTLNTQVAGKSIALTNLELTLAEVKTTLAVTEEEKTALTMRLETMLPAIQEMEILKTKLNEKIKALYLVETELAELDNLRNELSDKTATISELQTRIEYLAMAETQMAELEASITLMEEEKTVLTIRLAETMTALQEVATLKTALNEKTKALYLAETELVEFSNLRNELSEKTTIISELQTRIEHLAIVETQMVELEAFVVSIEKEKMVMIDRLKENLTDLKQVEVLKTALERKTREFIEAEIKQAELDKLTQELEKKANALHKLQGRVADLVRLESKVIDLQDSIKRLGNEKLVLAANLEQSQAALHVAEIKESELAKSLSEVKEQIQPLQAKHLQAEQLAEESAQKTDELALINKKLTEKEEEISRLQDQVDELTKKTEDLATLRQQPGETERNIIQIDKEIKVNEQEQAVNVTKDRDNDGVPDGQDKCPATPAKTVVDDTGCEVDRDGDGLVDRLDLCPDSIPGANVDELGCEASEKIVLSDITFALGTAKLTEASKESLTSVIKTLALHPELKLEVAGYTDSLGNINRNMSLSRQRAITVMNYLIDQGIHADRLTAKGYGPANPIADNNTPEGRALNRRVELHKVLPAVE